MGHAGPESQVMEWSVLEMLALVTRPVPVLSSPRVAPLCQKQGRVKDSTQLCQPQLKQQALGTISHCLLVFGSWAYIFLSIFGALLLSHVINITQCDGDTGPNNQMQHRLFLLV